MLAPPLYHIVGWRPRLGMGSCGFGITLFPGWKERIATHEWLNEESAKKVIETIGPGIIKQHFPYIAGRWDEKGFTGDQKEFWAVHELRLAWGEWGPEHISVPGDACGLDLDPHALGSSLGHVTLSPHNVDTLQQAGALLEIFLHFADILIADYVCEAYDRLLERKD